MSNKLKNETSPYLLQHSENPVDWYAWSDEAFDRAKKEDKPVFLSIGYSTCHWCHVMAHESFESAEVAEILNRDFISIKVDKEERPDIDSIYMTVCQAFTGSGGWPTSIFMTPDQKPFFAGTYFPKTSRGGMIGLTDLLTVIAEEWKTSRNELIRRAEDIVAQLDRRDELQGRADMKLINGAVSSYKRSYDEKNGGFGRAPKFPTPHNLLFLLAYYERYGDDDCLQMAEHTLMQMYRGGMFDHIGYGFSRYSTDREFLVPHFEKMLYDNALLMLAYTKAYEITKKAVYLETAEKTAEYILREMTSPHGGFYSAQDADSDGEEGKYYVFTKEEIADLLGHDAEDFCRHFGISAQGNFEGKSIPNLLGSDPADKSFDVFLPRIYDYRKGRCRLHLDDKLLTSWNGLMIAAMCRLYRASGRREYLTAALRADWFISENLCRGDALFVSFREGKRGKSGFLDDYASYIFALLSLHGATLDDAYLDKAERMCAYVLTWFRDDVGGFCLYGQDSEQLILRPKETYDGAIPSGNSLMAWNLVRLAQLTDGEVYRKEAERQLDFLAAHASNYPQGHAMFLLAMLEHFEPLLKITAVTAYPEEMSELPLTIPSDSVLRVVREPSQEFALKNGRTTYYVCQGHACLPPVNDLSDVINKKPVL